MDFGWLVVLLVLAPLAQLATPLPLALALALALVLALALALALTLAPALTDLDLLLDSFLRLVLAPVALAGAWVSTN